jgi:hypothetical protein
LCKSENNMNNNNIFQASNHLKEIEQETIRWVEVINIIILPTNLAPTNTNEKQLFDKVLHESYCVSEIKYFKKNSLVLSANRQTATFSSDGLAYLLFCRLCGELNANIFLCECKFWFAYDKCE